MISFLKNGNLLYRTMKKVLFVIPHPDDEIVGSCILIKDFLKKKKVSIVFLTNGVISPNTNWFWNRKNYKKEVSIRYQEMLKSLANLGVNDFFLQDIPTRTLKSNIDKSYIYLKEIILNKNIDTLFCPAYEGGHQDHDVTNFIVSKLKSHCKVFEFPEYNFYGRTINSNTFFYKNGTEIVIDLDNNQKLFKTKSMNIYKSEKKNLKYINLKQECFRPLASYEYSSPPHDGVLFYRRYSLFSWHPRVDNNSPIDICNEIRNSKIFNK